MGYALQASSWSPLGMQIFVRHEYPALDWQPTHQSPSCRKVRKSEGIARGL